MSYSLHEFYRNAGVIEIPHNLPDFPMAFVPRQDQIEGLNLVLREPRVGLFDDAGTGKTCIMQAYLLYYIGYGNKAVALMPPTLFYQFRKTFSDTFKGSDAFFSCQTFNSSKPKRDKLIAGYVETGAWPDLLIMTYELFIKLSKQLYENGYNVLVCDEAQKLRGSGSVWHAVVYNYTENPAEAALLLATGTPLHNTPLDGYAMTRLLDREIYGSLEGFKRKHCILKRFLIKKQVRNRRGQLITKRIRAENITGYKNLDTLHTNLYKFARRVTKDQVLSLKAPTLIPIDIEMSPAHRTVYSLMANEKMLELANDVVITATQATQLREHLMQIACNPEDYNQGTRPIQNNLYEQILTILDSLDSNKKVLIYAHHNKTLENLYAYLSEFNPALVYGGSQSTSSKNASEVRRFQEDTNCKILLSHPQSGGVGLNFQHVCHHIIFAEPTSIQGDFLQVLARVQRSGQEHAVIVYILKLIGTIYPSMVENMLEHSDYAAEVNLDGGTLRKHIFGGL